MHVPGVVAATMVEYLPLEQAIQTLSSEPPSVILVRLTGLPSAPEVCGAGVLEMTVVDSEVANDVETEMVVEDNNVDDRGVDVEELVLSGADEVVPCAGLQVVVMSVITTVYLPATQSIQVLDPDPAYLPAEQSVHVPGVVAATTVEYLPSVHPVQMLSSDPVPALYLPATQSRQVLDPDAACLPAPQSAHVSDAADECLPLPQSSHASDPAVPLNLPALHATHEAFCAKRSAIEHTSVSLLLN